MKEFDSSELAQYNGENGKPIYIAHAGKVYDVSESKLWRNGLHMKRHEIDVLERYPQIGILKKEIVDQEMPAAMDWLLKKFPMLRRHPHPMTVHFPIVFAFSATVFTVLYLITGLKSFDTTALHCLGGGVLFTIVGIATGLYTWWLNYMAKMLKPVKIKIPLSLSMLVIEIVLFIWRVNDPHVLDVLPGAGLIYLLLVLSLSGFVTVIGWNGASMTFPVEHD